MIQDWAQVCQFCRTDVSRIPRAKSRDPDDHRARVGSTPKWIWIAYYVISVLWVFDGLTDLLAALNVFPKRANGDVNILLLVFGVFSLAVGLGLILRAELARGVVNVLAAINLIAGFLGLFGAFLGAGFSPAWGAYFMIMNVIQIAVAGMTIYIIGETDGKAPNI